jgi:hypothetical protein
MAAAGKPLEDKDSISYVLAGHDQDYNLFMVNVSGKDEISLGPLYSQFEGREKATREGGWEPIKISRRNSAYVPKSIQLGSLLTRSRPHSYWTTIGFRNRVR